jgi:hypothetical protein
LSERPDAVARPLDLLVKRPDQGERPLPSGTQVADVFDSMDQSLLILGAPGSGKTTLLLELARDLLDRAAGDSAHPVPVVFPLSTWAESRKPLVEWLQDELNPRYDVLARSLRHGWRWIRSYRCSTADEVKAEHRARVEPPSLASCAASFSGHHQSHGHYEALAGLLASWGPCAALDPRAGMST